MMKIPEFGNLLISWIVISICFSVAYLFSDQSFFLIAFLLAAGSAGAGFLLHELAHRTVARRYGCHAVYQMWLWGVVLALVIAILTQGQLIFAALGAVYITPMAFSATVDTNTWKRVYGLISLAGPSMNLLLVAVFFLLSQQGGLVGNLGYTGVYINLWLAAFNLIPIPPFDGSKIFSWSKIVWAAFTIPAWLLLFFVI
jgi:Zn-dependent protease